MICGCCCKENIGSCHIQTFKSIKTVPLRLPLSSNSAMTRTVNITTCEDLELEEKGQLSMDWGCLRSGLPHPLVKIHTY